MTIQECVNYTIFSIHSLLQYIVSVTYTKFLYMDMTIALKSSNEMQQTASMRFTIIQHDITVIYVTYLLSNVLLFNAVISLDYGLRTDIHKMMFVDCKFLKPYYISHIMKCVSFSADKALPCNSPIHYLTLNNRNSYSVNIQLFLILTYRY